MPGARRGTTRHRVHWEAVERTAGRMNDALYRLSALPDGLAVTAGEAHHPVGDYAAREKDTLVVKLSPGGQTYYEAREHQREPISEAQLVASVIVATLAGHPDAEKDRAGTPLQTVWSHHLALVTGSDPRRVATTYASAETKKIGYRIQHFAARGIELVDGEAAKDETR